MGFDFSKGRLAYGQHQVLEDLDFKIKAGERVAIIGKSGAGKSTLLLALRAQLAQQVAWCPQQPGLVPMLSCHHNIYMGQLEQHSFFVNLCRLIYPGKKVKQEIAHISQRLALSASQFTPCQQLSGGQQQRTAIGRAIYSRKSIFLGDEPVSALDEYHAPRILNMLCEHFNTLVLALHDVQLAKAHCQRIIALKDGRILFDKDSQQVSAADIHQVYN
ncbi:MAG: ATP-binding cassette domain-containing protein [Bermanella sp.]